MLRGEFVSGDWNSGEGYGVERVTWGCSGRPLGQWGEGPWQEAVGSIVFLAFKREGRDAYIEECAIGPLKPVGAPAGGDTQKTHCQILKLARDRLVHTTTVYFSL